MWHVDDGGLHAYLDDALDALAAGEAERVREHLASCDACRLRLDEERRVRGETLAILSQATPDMGLLPTLEELKERARSSGSGSRVAPTRLWRLGWAASLVLAAGTGWLLRGGVSPSGRVATEPVVTKAAPSAPSLKPAAVGSAEEARPAPPPEAVTQRSAEASASRSPGGAETRAAAAGTAKLGLRAPNPTLVSESLLKLQTRPLFPQASLDAVAPGGIVVADTPATVLAASNAVTIPQPEALARMGKARLGGIANVQLAENLMPPSAATDSRKEAFDVLPGAQHVVVSADRGAPDSAGSVAGGPGSLAVPGLPILDVSWYQKPGPGGGVRVLQRLTSGDTLELIGLPPGVDASLAMTPPVDGRTQVVEARAGGWLIARARMSRPALESLVRLLVGVR